jgi:hypothetical protein
VSWPHAHPSPRAVPQPLQAEPAEGVASGNVRDPCLAGLSPARSQPRRHGFSLTDSYRVPWYDYAVTHLRDPRSSGEAQWYRGRDRSILLGTDLAGRFYMVLIRCGPRSLDSAGHGPCSGFLYDIDSLCDRAR